jgi:hypothetical protein
MSLDNVSPVTHNDLTAIANKHETFDSFMEDMHRLADLVWHNSRVQDARSEEAVAAVKTAQPIPEPEGDPTAVSQPAMDPAGNPADEAAAKDAEVAAKTGNGSKTKTS